MTVSRPVGGVLSALSDVVAIHLSGLPGDCSDGAGGLPMSHVRPCSGWGLPSRPSHPGRWCALAAPFHPCLCGLAPAIGGLLSVALSFGSPRLAVSQHPALWSPDLPRHGPRPRTSPWRGHPADSPSRSVCQVAGPDDTAPYAAEDRRRPPPSLGFATWTRSPSGSPSWSSPSRCPSPRSTARSRRRSRPRSLGATCSGCGARSRASPTAPGTVTWTSSTPTRRRGRDTPVLKVNCWGRTWGPLKTTLGRRASSSSPARWCRCGAGSSSTPPRARSTSSPSDVDVTALLGTAGGAPSCPAPHPRDRGPPATQPGLGGARSSPCASASWPARDPRATTTSSVSCRDRISPSPSSCSGPMSKGPGARPRSPGRCVPWPVSDCDVAVLVRGGGSRGDLAAFDAEPVARAIATLPIPLWTGIGHTGDQSVADIVANQAFVTPTACAQELVRRVGEWWESVTRSGARVGTLRGRRAGGRGVARRHGPPPPRHRHPQPAVPALRTSGAAERRRSPTNARRQLEFAGDAVERRTARVGPRARGRPRPPAGQGRHLATAAGRLRHRAPARTGLHHHAPARWPAWCARRPSSTPGPR